MVNFFFKIAEAAVLAEYPTLPLLDKIISTIINPLIVTLTGFALLYFLWGVAQYLKKSAEGADKGEGKNHVMWGIVGLTIMVSALGVLEMIKSFWTK